MSDRETPEAEYEIPSHKWLAWLAAAFVCWAVVAAVFAFFAWVF